MAFTIQTLSGPASPPPPHPIETPRATLPPGSEVYDSGYDPGGDYAERTIYARTPNGQIRRLSRLPRDIDAPQLSPDVTHLAGYNERSELVVGDLDGRNSKVVARDVYSATASQCPIIRWLTPQRLAYTTGIDIRKSTPTPQTTNA